MDWRKITILLILFTSVAIAQVPEFNWGTAIERDPRQLENMEIIGVDDDGFYAKYETDGQITLEHYNPQNIRLWTTALLPKTPEGQIARFHSVQMIQGTLYMISSSIKDGHTVVYAQEIKHNGNYAQAITPIARGKFGKQIHIAVAQNGEALIVVLSGDNKQLITSSLLTSRLDPRWTQVLSSSGDMQEVLVHADGTVFLLTKALAASPATSSFYFYHFEPRRGKFQEIVLGDEDYRPLQAKMIATTRGETIVTGYMIPSSSVASQDPEPIGTFYYRFNNYKLQDPVVNYSPFKEEFILNYKRFKPDNDRSQRLRHLQLDEAVLSGSAGAILIGEVKYTDNQGSTHLYHYNDIIVTRLHDDGNLAYITSANKLQAGTAKDARFHSYFATTIGNELKVIYLHIDYDSTSFMSSSTRKTPVLVNILPDGTKQIIAIQNDQTGQQPRFHICPTSAFQTSQREFIILGIGRGYYKYGRMRFN